MHVRNSGFGCDPSRRGQIGAATTDSVPKFGKNVETVGQHAGRGDASIGTRFGGAPSSTFLGLSRTVGHHARWQDTPAAEEVRGIVCRPGHKDIVRLPTGMASAAGGLEHPDNLLVERARMQADSASTHVGEQLRDFQGQPPEFKGIVAGAMEMPQVRLIFCAAVPSPAARIGGSRATRTSGAQRHQILDLGQRISQKTRGRSRRRDGRALTIFAF
jgi:hypothetical protein